MYWWSEWCARVAAHYRISAMFWEWLAGECEWSPAGKTHYVTDDDFDALNERLYSGKTAADYWREQGQ